MKKLSLALVCFSTLISPVSSSAFASLDICYDVGVKFANQRAVSLCSAAGRRHHSRIVVSRACVRAALSGCKDTLVASIRDLQDSGDCNLRPFSTLAGELLKEKECRKLLDIARD